MLQLLLFPDADANHQSQFTYIQSIKNLITKQKTTVI